MERILMESSEWNALLISGVTRSVYWSGCCLSCCAAVLDVWRHPVKVNAAAMHAMAMMICFFMICDGCGVFCWSARSAVQQCASLARANDARVEQRRNPASSACAMLEPPFIIRNAHKACSHEGLH